MCYQYYSDWTLWHSADQVTVEKVVLAFHIQHYLNYQFILTQTGEIHICYFVFISQS